MSDIGLLGEVDKILSTNTGSISELVHEYRENGGEPSGIRNLVNQLPRYLKEGDFHPSPEHMDEIWELAGNYENTDLIDVLLKLQGGKCSSKNLMSTLSQYARGFHYILGLMKEYPDFYKYESDSDLYKLLTRIMPRFYEWGSQKDTFHYSYHYSEKILRYFLRIWTSEPVLQKDLNELIYHALMGGDNWYNPQIVNVLIEFGADPFADCWEGNINMGVPIVFKVIDYDCLKITPLLVCATELKGWNITDEWGRNLLHYVTDNQEIYEGLLKKGVNPNHRALIDDQAKVVIAKMKGTLPKEYGKTPRELVEF